MFTYENHDTQILTHWHGVIRGWQYVSRDAKSLLPLKDITPYLHYV
jgi:hypothetical protein